MEWKEHAEKKVRLLNILANWGCYLRQIDAPIEPLNNDEVVLLIHLNRKEYYTRISKTLCEALRHLFTKDMTGLIILKNGAKRHK